MKYWLFVFFFFIFSITTFSKDPPAKISSFDSFCEQLQKVPFPKNIEGDILSSIRSSEIPKYFPVPRNAKLRFSVQKKEGLFFLGFAIKGKESFHFYPFAKVNSNQTLSLLSYSLIDLCGIDNQVEFQILFSSKGFVFQEDSIESKIDRIFCKGLGDNLFRDDPTLRKKISSFFREKAEDAYISLTVGFYHRVGFRIDPHFSCEERRKAYQKKDLIYVYFGEITPQGRVFLERDRWKTFSDSEWKAIKNVFEDMGFEVFEKENPND